jgi:hypothetical protein
MRHTVRLIGDSLLLRPDVSTLNDRQIAGEHDRDAVEFRSATPHLPHHFYATEISMLQVAPQLFLIDS